jgi:hypothetical protein
MKPDLQIIPVTSAERDFIVAVIGALTERRAVPPGPSEIAAVIAHLVPAPDGMVQLALPDRERSFVHLVLAPRNLRAAGVLRFSVDTGQAFEFIDDAGLLDCGDGRPLGGMVLHSARLEGTEPWRLQEHFEDVWLDMDVVELMLRRSARRWEFFRTTKAAGSSESTCTLKADIRKAIVAGWYYDAADAQNFKVITGEIRPGVIRRAFATLQREGAGILKREEPGPTRRFARMCLDWDGGMYKTPALRRTPFESKSKPDRADDEALTSMVADFA